MSYKQRKVWNILGLVFDEISLSETIEQTKQAVVKNQDCFISTPNLNFVITANSNDIFFNSVIESDLSVADGMPIIWVAKLLGIPIRERVAGSTLFEALTNQINESEKIKVFFFGGMPGVARQAHDKLNEKDSYLMSCGYYDPGFVDVDLMSDQTTLDYINGANPDFIVVALGAEKGQKWILKNKEKLNAPVISHLGAVINFVAGTVDRAPILWQKFGLEWIWRIKQEPQLWQRYLFDGVKFLYLLSFKVLPLAIYDRILKMRYLGHSILLEQESPYLQRYLVQGELTFKNVERFFEKLTASTHSNKNVFLNLSKLKYIDAAGIARLILLQNSINSNGRKLILKNVPIKLKILFYLNNVFQRFNINN